MSFIPPFASCISQAVGMQSVLCEIQLLAIPLEAIALGHMFVSG